MFKRALLSTLLLMAAAHSLAQVTTPPSAEPSAPPVNSSLDGELFYQLLIGEISTLRNEPGTGYALLLDGARKTNDARLYQRAIDIALQARSGDLALQATKAWRQAQPQSRDANRYLLQILIALNRIGEVLEPLQREVALSDAKDRNLVLYSLPAYFVRSTDKKQAASLVEQAVADQLNSAQYGAAAWSSVGRMRLEAGDNEGALEAAKRGAAIDPQSEGPITLALVLMSPKVPEAENLIRKYLAGQPQIGVRIAYARALIEDQRYAEAYVQAKRVAEEKPDQVDAWLIRGTLELQDQQLDASEASFKKFLELMQQQRGTQAPEETSRAISQAYLSLAQIAEQRKDYKQAEAWLARITNPDTLIRAQTRRAGILARQGKMSEARELIRGLPERAPGDARMKLSSEVQLLRDNKQYQAAYELLAEATKRDPKDYDLLYDQATLAEKLGNTTEMERILRRIINEKPDYHHAYNALGYSYADRNIRLAEARQLITKALEYAPEDPYISDSLGWVEFRSGNKQEALKVLQKAYRARPDAEIAAHLGEVLWQLGQKEQALAVWREGMKLNAENETLLETIKRLRAKL